MNFKRNKDELSAISRKILEYNFKQEALEVYEGTDTKTILKYVQWEEKCKKLMDTFLSRDYRNSGIILFPDTETSLKLKYGRES